MFDAVAQHIVNMCVHVLPCNWYIFIPCEIDLGRTVLFYNQEDLEKSYVALFFFQKSFLGANVCQLILILIVI